MGQLNSMRQSSERRTALGRLTYDTAQAASEISTPNRLTARIITATVAIARPASW